jgi:hypothetical protein
MTVPLNETREFEFNLSHLCKFDELGTYRIVAEKMLMSGSHEVVVSNPFYLTVVAGQWKDTATNSFRGFGGQSKL